MKKWKCVVDICPNQCVLETMLHPIGCPCDPFDLPDWQEVTADEILQPDLQDKPLPKLTAEVFDRPDCPVWAKWAAVDNGGNAMWYEGEPQAIGGAFWNSKRGQIQEIPGEWDASEWQNSLIERPAKLPDWCKVGELVYRKENRKYYKVKEIFKYRIHYRLFGGEEVLDAGIGCIDEFTQARLRPYNAEEMRALIGKVIIENKSGDIGLVTGYCNRKESVYAGRNDFVADLLLSDYTIGGQPCGKLEHMENREWVE